MQAAAVPSPCVRRCSVESTSGSCSGCLRTLDEIAAWASMPEARRAEVVASLPARATRRDLAIRAG